MSSVQTIRFCNVCENKMYHQVDQDHLIYYCRVCDTKDTQMNTGVCVLNIQYNDNGTNGGEKPIQHVYNKYTKIDPTLPHLALPCPNEQCKTNKQEPKESDIIYLRYDNAQMKHLYICAECDYVWKS
jgi:DNA-directed RNA polymerase subunit M/transcription elongation factor TFIIS